KMQTDFLENTLFTLEDVNKDLNAKLIIFEEFMIYCNSNSKAVIKLKNEVYSTRLIDISDYFGKNIGIKDKIVNNRIIKYREWIESKIFSKTFEQKEFDRIINEWKKENITLIYEWSEGDITLFEDLLKITEDNKEFKTYLEEYENERLLNLLDNIRLINENINSVIDKRYKQQKLNEKANKLIDRINKCFC
ncbi:13069_t:CDS:1, partial [Cetraspora pellucida]